MNSDSDQQHHLLFFPLMAKGHVLPSLDMAKLLASRNVKSTIVTTTVNAPLITNSIQKSHDFATNIALTTITFPTQESGLPEGLESLDLVTNQETHHKFFLALPLLQEPLEKLVQELRPNGLVADMFFPWSAEVASKFKIPRLIFHGTSFFSMCCLGNLGLHQPHKQVSSDTELFLLPGFPDPVKFTRLQIPEDLRLQTKNYMTNLLDSARESEKKSYGMIVNSFYELEPAYVEYYREVLGRKAWHIGPVSLCNRDVEDKAQRGKETPEDEYGCMKWLDSKKPNSVVYVCFGTNANFTDAQLREIAEGLEASGQEFIWVVRKEKNDQENDEKWLPEGFENRMEGKGLIVRGWAPQVLILDHVGVGGFVTHCGWNSTLEGISAGLPMVTWPIFADQFFNEKLITEILRIGVCVGVKQWVRLVGDYVKASAVEKAVKEIMVGENAGEMRSRARKLGEMARNAVAEGGSSCASLSALIEDLRSYND